jgi:hypothetical protein
MHELARTLEGLRRGPIPPEASALADRVRRTLDCLCCESAGRRPRDESGRPGGMIVLDRTVPTVLVGDLHGRMDYLSSVLAFQPEGDAEVIDLLASGAIQVVCLGDGLHAEGRAAQRWRAGLEEYAGGYERHDAMDEEMREGLGTMGMVMETKLAFPAQFHFLKGNHENIANEEGDGNFPFRKFVLEGAMVAEYLRRFYGEDLLGAWARFEKQLPLLAVGGTFLASHAEPRSFYSRDRVVGYRDDPEVVEGLTWTDNDEAEPGSVAMMLEHYLGAAAGTARYFGGHRPAAGAYQLRAEGRYVQIHDPDGFRIALLRPAGAVDPARDVITIENRPLAAG